MRTIAISLLLLAGVNMAGAQESARLPPVVRRGTVSLEEALSLRRSVRSFTREPLSEQAVSQLLWATQGVTDPAGYRTAPSAGALYPLELYVVTAQGVFRYRPGSHELVRHRAGDLRQNLQRAALDQDAVGGAPAVFVIAAEYHRTAVKYGEGRARRYATLEAGHAAQNLLLEAVALKLGAVPVGALNDAAVQAALGLPAEHEPLYLIPVGHPGR